MQPEKVMAEKGKWNQDQGSVPFRSIGYDGQAVRCQSILQGALVCQPLFYSLHSLYPFPQGPSKPTLVKEYVQKSK